MKHPSLIWLQTACLLITLRADDTVHHQPVRIVSPVEQRSKLAVVESGLAVLDRVSGPVVPVVVIGPYRSGKSFLLNQLLNVSCGLGFGVGHTRRTETKGIWMWSEPRAIAAADGTQASMLFFDTEGFESTGKADAYDDRIFALSTLISAILLYNLPETVRESDIEKLSFAVELAKAFYPTEHGRGSGQAEQAAPVEPGSMLWVIQRDFLEGDSVGKMVHEALSPVANPQSDHDIAQMNQVRQGLRSIARNSTAIGLKQPHLNRTQLCQLTDAELNPDYRTGRDRLRALVSALAQPKMIRGKVMDGPALSALVRQMVAALNEGDIPSATSIVQNFNRDLLYRCLEQYAEEMLAAQLPLQELELQSAHEAAQARAMARFDRQHFGNPSVDSSSGSTLRDGLLAAIAKEYRSRVAENTVASSKRCDMLEAECERELDLLQSARLPSLNRFQARFQRCNVKFQHGCFGPAAASTDGRLQRQYDRELHRFRQQYNDRLFNGLVGVSIADIIVFRFLSRNPSLELLGWAGFLFLEVSPKLLLGSGGLYESPWWLALARVWEMVVYNPVADLETWWPALVLVAAVGFAFRRWRLWRARRTKRHRRRQSKKRRGWHTTSSSDEDGEGKDLDV